MTILHHAGLDENSSGAYILGSVNNLCVIPGIWDVLLIPEPVGTNCKVGNVKLSIFLSAKSAGSCRKVTAHRKTSATDVTISFPENRFIPSKVRVNFFGVVTE